MSLLFLCSLQASTGNATTVHRIKGHFESAGYITIAHDVDEIRDNAQLEEIMHNYQPPIKAIIGVHAYRAGRLIPGAEIPEIALKNENNEGNEEFKIANNLLRSTCPWILILGGTDVNENVKDPKLMNTMTKAIQFASKIVAFTPTMKDLAISNWPMIESKIHLITQAVFTEPVTFSLREHLKLGEDSKILLLVAGLRKVKDPLYLLDVFRIWRKSNPNIYFLIIGPQLDQGYSQQVIQEIEKTEGAIYYGEMPPQHLHASIIQADIVVNSSISEGLSNALLESMNLGTIVVARDIAGNRSLIRDGELGFLYHTPDDFLRIAKNIIEGKAHNLNEIKKRAINFVIANHGLQKERELYISLLEALFSDE